VLGIILLVIAILYATRIPSIRRDTWEAYPAQNPALFDQWRRKELQTIYILIAATWGLMILFFGFGFALGIAFYSDEKQLDSLVDIFNVIHVVMLFAGLIWSGIVGNQAKKLKMQLAIPSTPTEGAYPRVGPIVNMPAPPPEVFKPNALKPTDVSKFDV